MLYVGFKALLIQDLRLLLLSVALADDATLNSDQYPAVPGLDILPCCLLKLILGVVRGEVLVEGVMGDVLVVGVALITLELVRGKSIMIGEVRVFSVEGVEVRLLLGLASILEEVMIMFSCSRFISSMPASVVSSRDPLPTLPTIMNSDLLVSGDFFILT